MEKNLKWLITLVLCFVLLSLSIVYADTSQVVTLGSDLSESQKKTMLSLFKVDRSKVAVIEVTNSEEKKYLTGLVSDSLIGTKAISSVLVELLDEGKGIQVDTTNINWVTPEMYANALVTAGVKDAYIHAAAPFSVSGTAALTGVLKGFEKATGKYLGENEKKVANEEMVRTGEIGQAIGDKEKAIVIVRESKEQVLATGEKDRKDIQRIIIEVAKENNVELTGEQEKQLTDLLEKISNLDLKVNDIQTQLEKMQGKLEQINQTSNEVKSLIQQIIDLLNQIIQAISRVLKG